MSTSLRQLLRLIVVRRSPLFTTPARHHLYAPRSLHLQPLLAARSLFSSLPRYNASASSSPSPVACGHANVPDPPKQPSYQLHFTCRPCQTRSDHIVSKQAYHHGTVLIQCPKCQNRHVFADHLKIFSEKAKSLEDILKENGEVIKRGTLLPNGDVELMPENVEKLGHKEKILSKANRTTERKPEKDAKYGAAGAEGGSNGADGEDFKISKIRVGEGDDLPVDVPSSK